MEKNLGKIFVYKDGAHILRTYMPFSILRRFCWVNDVRPKLKSRFKYEIKFDLYYKLRNKEKILKKTLKIGFLRFLGF